MYDSLLLKYRYIHILLDFKSNKYSKAKRKEKKQVQADKLPRTLVRIRQNRNVRMYE